MLQSGCFYIHPLLFNIKIVEQNKEANPLLTKGFGFCFAKQGGKSSAPARAVAFCLAKQGGLDAGFY
jgi:hypothetical protein